MCGCLRTREADDDGGGGDGCEVGTGGYTVGAPQHCSALRA
eukprot:CAMPEP_0115305700 /NCGR_PEP_ID=MMETSP0270-20121206/72172_1 /TAXON_ID=71861 /ORGANISM="Scrippsiella trochoidea, Strain CCMP3099" /LENGTH=40 /DNA_ID= /DNA_START= /DNA_END= /DNA_ORIENTATION=